MDGLPRTVTIAAGIGAAINGGVFFGFSTFVMDGIGRLAPQQSIAAMQSINRSAPTAGFMSMLFGTAALCVTVAVVGFRRLGDAAAPYLLAGAALFLLAIVLTAAYHVPRNDALALVDPNASGAAHTWAAYARGWTAWNHVRTVTCIGAAVSFALGLRAA